MQKLDRLVWADGISIRAYGMRIGLRATKKGALEEFLPSLPPGWKTMRSQVVDRLYSVIVGGESAHRNIRLFNLVYANANRIARTPELHQAIDAFETDLQMYVAEMSPHRLFVHAGVVAWRGKAVVIPGKSFSGKSTLTSELVKAGAIYYSDEYAVLDARGRVHHYARPLSIRESGHLERPKKYQVEALGGRAGNKPLPVGLVVVSKYREGATWRPRRLSAGEGALELIANTVSARREPQRVLSTLNQVVAGAPVLKGFRGDARQVVDYIFETLSR
ncbi:MAG TPA: hypothetical protein VNS63_04885 [Blastocatellia bacterium]|nr:hypothetical protein [Blastocatellia bacterium]